MPTVLRDGPYRFYFYSHELNEPPHVHIDRDDLSAKFWLEPVSLARNLRFNARVAEDTITGNGESERVIGSLA